MNTGAMRAGSPELSWMSRRARCGAAVLRFEGLPEAGRPLRLLERLSP